jgi:MYXO-CTERM domain-containing protein
MGHGVGSGCSMAGHTATAPTALFLVLALTLIAARRRRSHAA